PKFPSYPFENMPWSKTPVVSCILAITHSGLLPSAHCKASAFSAKGGLSNVHNYTFFGAQYRACILDSSGFGLPFQSPVLALPADFTTNLLAKL
ncbi:MAG: hypothetical protein J7K30_14665, partial [Deltaproteobacteria bacterium]|nr:hypothetical protein [Deltaproteobacteria bacterium]